MKVLFLFSILFIFTKQHMLEDTIILNSSPAAEMKAPLTQSACTVKLKLPISNDVLSQNYVDEEKLESKWQFSWFPCQGATKYHLYVIARTALNPIINNDSITNTSFLSKRISYGITQLEGWTWKVRAYVGGQWGEWSEIRTFNVSPALCTISGKIFGTLEGVSYSDVGREHHIVKLEKVYLTTPDGKKVKEAKLYNRQYLFKNVPVGKTYRIYPDIRFKSDPEYIEISNTISKTKYNKKNFTIKGVKGEG